MKKKLLALLLMSACVFTSLTGCGGEDAKEGQTSSGGQKFTVGFDAEYPPYGYMDDNGDYTGFDLELSQAVADMEGWELVKQPIEIKQLGTG